MNTSLQIKEQLYQRGVKLAKRFCDVNKIPHPIFITYDELSHAFVSTQETADAIRFARKVMPNAALVGAHTGLYSRGVIFVNVAVTALPVQQPGMRRWSWPGWKTDRTAVGVVAHELGHYVEECLRSRDERWWGRSPEWDSILKQHKKQVSSYEPKQWEAWAETMRLFILNPHLLKFALPHRFQFIKDQCSLKPSEPRGWNTVLANKNYFAAAERWIAAPHG